jgi:hypothetical protein
MTWISGTNIMILTIVLLYMRDPLRSSYSTLLKSKRKAIFPNRIYVRHYV